MKDNPGKTFYTGIGDQSAQVTIDQNKCNHCGHCYQICPTDTIIKDENGYSADIDHGAGCIGCGHCMSVCEPQAIQVSGRKMSSSNIFDLPDKKADFESLYSLLASRRSTRHFTDQEISQEILNKILDASALAPMGLPPWDIEVTVINGKKKVEEFADDSIQTFSRGIKIISRIVPLLKLFIPKTPYNMMKKFVIPITNIIINDHKKGKDHLLYNAPAVVIFHNNMGGEADSAIACTYAMVIAQSLGLGTCMIGTIPPFLQKDSKIKKKWKMPLHKKIGMAMILGHPKIKPCNGIKRSFASIHYI